LTVGRNISLSGNLSLGSAIGGDLFVKVVGYSSGTFSPNNRLVSFNGTTPQLTGQQLFWAQLLTMRLVLQF
jgi:hypothetical protein